jgi:Sulfotransferase family
MSLPNFFVIGAAKAGTTSLHRYLDQHPEIQMSATKEPRFFAGPANGIPYPPDRVWSREEYELLFDPAFALRGEASTDYAAHPRRQGVPERIKELVPEAKFVYLVRDPIARTISHFQMAVALMGERRSLKQALGDLSDHRSPYIASSLYGSQLENYLRHFPQERMLVLDHAKLRSERRSTLARVFAFLGVDEGAEVGGLDDELLSSSEWRTYSPRYVSLVDRFVAPPLRWIPKGVRRSLRRSVESLLWPPLEKPAVDAELQARLEELYAPEADRLRALTGEEFSNWTV